MSGIALTNGFLRLWLSAAKIVIFLFVLVPLVPLAASFLTVLLGGGPIIYVIEFTFHKLKVVYENAPQKVILGVFIEF